MIAVVPNATYAVDDGLGNILADGLQWYNAKQTAQDCADRLGVNVYLYDRYDTEGPFEEFEHVKENV